MSKPAFTVSIPEPCHENWNEMTPREQGRFCAVCTKTVVDFSVMSDAELFNTIKNGAANMCGHFHKDQLDRTISAPKKPRWILQPFWKYFVGLFLFIKPAGAKAQGKPVCAPVVPPPTHVKVGTIAVDRRPANIEKEITGTVMNSNNEKLTGVVVNVKGTTRYTITDSKGNFKIKAFIGEQLEFTDLQYDPAIYRIGQENTAVIRLEKPEPNIKYMGEPAIVEVSKPVEFIMEVTDKKTGKPVAGAAISWSNEKNNGTKNADKKGNASVKLPVTQSDILFLVDANGYDTEEFTYTVSGLKGKKKVTLKFLLDRIADRMPIMGKVSASCIKEPELDVTLKNIPAGNLPQPVVQPLVGRLGGVRLTSVDIENKVNPIPPAGKSQLRTFPNPVQKNEPFTIEFTHHQQEIMMAQVVDATGRIILNQRFEAFNGLNREQILLPPTAGAGAIVVKLMNSKGQWIGTEKLVVK